MGSCLSTSHQDYRSPSGILEERKCIGTEAYPVKAQLITQVHLLVIHSQSSMHTMLLFRMLKYCLKLSGLLQGRFLRETTVDNLLLLTTNCWRGKLNELARNQYALVRYGEALEEHFSGWPTSTGTIKRWHALGHSSALKNSFLWTCEKYIYALWLICFALTVSSSLRQAWPT